MRIRASCNIGEASGVGQPRIQYPRDVGLSKIEFLGDGEFVIHLSSRWQRPRMSGEFFSGERVMKIRIKRLVRIPVYGARTISRT